jgi:hypothetical protein
MAVIALPLIVSSSSIAHNIAYNANYDIVWSFDYTLSGSGQGSFTTFLFDGGVQTLTGGGIGKGGAYCNIDNITVNSAFTTVDGVSGAILGINFDTTGIFALSGNGVAGISASDINSISIRSGQSALFGLLTSVAISSVDTEFNLKTGEGFNRLRFRLTDIGQTIIVSRQSTTGKFVDILSTPTNLTINDDTLYKIGIGYTSPVSGASSTKCKFAIRNAHFEGKTDSPTYNYSTAPINLLPAYPLSAFNNIVAPGGTIIENNLQKIVLYSCVSIPPAETTDDYCLVEWIPLSGNMESFTLGGFTMSSRFINVSAVPVTTPPPTTPTPPPTTAEPCVCTQHISLETYVIPDRLKVMHTGNSITALDTGWIATNGTPFTATLTGLPCDTIICINAPTGGTLWDLVATGCVNVTESGGQGVEFCWSVGGYYMPAYIPPAMSSEEFP